MALTPRMEPYARLRFRLYEALVLLSIIRPIGGPHIVSQLGTYTTQGVQRRFFKNLAFLCDYKKGGSTATAIAVEDCYDCYVFWVASNEGAGDKVVDFLEDVLKILRMFCESINDMDRATAEEALLVRCTALASDRLRQEARILRNSARKCRLSLENSDEEIDARVVKWLQQFESMSPFTTLCRTAYRSRNVEEMRRIEQLGQGTEGDPRPEDLIKAFRTVRHMIGRLAARVRNVNQLLDDSGRVETLLKAFQVAAVQRPVSASVPEADAHTTLPRILNRILPEADVQHESCLGVLRRLDTQVKIEGQLQDKFTAGGLHPCVHAEVQILHHFYDSGRRYVSNDRYIACSKPACVGCESYARHHPARITLLDAHQKVYPSWGIVNLVGGKQNPGWINQRKIINDVIGDLKGMVIARLGELHAATVQHPDSLTEITASSLVDVRDSGSETEEADDSDAGPSSEVFSLDSAIELLDLSTESQGVVQMEHGSGDIDSFENGSTVQDNEGEDDDGGGAQL
ncbi:hypothetical protein HER10_EVM0001360 [Colletotrichum scovillei]|uniref:uncharacterized protein n=1 Tax=Colletotrichum scovillei TaxID=1209932 RepID=UPI0015C3EADE|nr:uncharacterized protein HER10_EVM0001360 [Colletotrichum scovillei]KAF4773046.1 hypothetical protein HER10_EVM0001360 [Colletotrichum scovillei]KAG7056588.1 hypothetical protein JMJ78_0000384 [Colletotrichum scovillei]